MISLMFNRIIQYNYNLNSMQQQYKTQQLINRINYRKHKQKLNEIKNSFHNTSLQFYSSAKSKPIDRKKILMLKIKRQQIEQENQNLRRKIQKMSNRQVKQQPTKRRVVTGSETKRISSSVANSYSKKLNRYADLQEGDKIEVASDYGDGQNIKCFIPSTKYKVKYSSMSQSKASQLNAIIFNINGQKKSIPKGSAKNLSPIQKQAPQIVQLQQNPQFPNLQSGQIQPNAKIKYMIRQSINCTKDELLYNEPEKEAHRIVVYKKTKIPFPMVSFLIQISLIDKQILITAYGMGAIAEDFKLLLSRKRTKEVIEEYRGNYEALWENINVDQYGIKINGQTQQENEGGKTQEQGNSEILKQKMRQKRYEITQDFLQRNYYTLMKQTTQEKLRLNQNQEENKVEEKQRLSKNKRDGNMGSGIKPRTMFKKADKKQKGQRSFNKPLLQQIKQAKQKSESSEKWQQRQREKTEKQEKEKNQCDEEYYQQFEESKKETENREEQSENYQQDYQDNLEGSKQLKNSSYKSQQKSKNIEELQEYEDSFLPQDLKKSVREDNGVILQQEYSMQFTSNPSNLINKSMLKPKKATMNNSSVIQEVEDRSKNQMKNGTSEKQELQQQYVQQFDN